MEVNSSIPVLANLRFIKYRYFIEYKNFSYQCTTNQRLSHLHVIEYFDTKYFYKYTQLWLLDF